MANGSNTADAVELTKADVEAHAAGAFSEVSAWLLANWLEIAISMAVGIGIFLLLHLIKRWGIGVCKRGEGVATWYAVGGRAIAKTGNLFIIMASARLVIGYADAPPSVHSTVVFLFTISAVLQAAIWLREVVVGAVENRTLDQANASAGLSSALGIIRLLVTIVIFALAAVVVLSNLGVNVTGLVAGLGVGGIAIGLAAQGIFADLFAALAILFDRPFRVGDSISYDKGAGSGTVEAIGLKSTRVRGGNGEERIIANKKLLDFEILNTTRRNHNRFKFDFHLGYATAPEMVEHLPVLLKEAVESEGYTLIHGGLNAFAPSGLSYDVEFESSGNDFPADARDRVAAAILRRFGDSGIGFAYPTQISLIAEKTKPTPPAGTAASNSG